jgi:hypothetical protein
MEAKGLSPRFLKVIADISRRRIKWLLCGARPQSVFR